LSFAVVLTVMGEIAGFVLSIAGLNVGEWLPLFDVLAVIIEVTGLTSFFFVVGVGVGVGVGVAVGIIAVAVAVVIDDAIVVGLTIGE